MRTYFGYKAFVSGMMDVIDVVGFYKRANIRLATDEYGTIEYSDCTEYSANAERCQADTVLKDDLTQSCMEKMTFDEFVSTIRHTRWTNRDFKSEIKTKQNFKSRDVASGHWILSKHRVRRHTRPSTVLYTAPAIEYELVEFGKTTTQTTFFNLPTEKRKQLYRSYYELVQYVPWKGSPDETFLKEKVQDRLANKDRHVIQSDETSSSKSTRTCGMKERLPFQVAAGIVTINTRTACIS